MLLLNLMDSGFLLSLVTFATISILLCLLYIISYMYLNGFFHFPQPFPNIPMKFESKMITGHLHLFGDEALRGLETLTVKGADKETGLSSFYMFNRPAIGCLAPEDVRRVLNNSNYRKPIPFLSIHIEYMLGKKAIVLLMNEEWKVHRRIVANAFKHEHFSQMVSSISIISNKVSQSLRERCLNSDSKVISLDLLQQLKKLTIDVFGLVAFSFEFNSSTTDSQDNLTEAFDFIMLENKTRSFKETLNVFQYFYSLPTARNIKYRESKKLVRDTLLKIINNKKREVEENQFEDVKDDLLKYMISSSQEEGFISDSEMADELIMLLFAGYDTTSIALLYAIWEISKNPEIEKKMIQEIETVLGERDSMTEADCQKLTYVKCVFKESLRKYPPAHLTTRNLTSDVLLGPKGKETLVPEGTPIYVPIYYIHRFNFEEPEVFRPERFLPVDEGGTNFHQYSYIPFSGGRRNCVGMKFAEMEGVMLLATLIKNFKFFDGPDSITPVSQGFVQSPKDQVFMKMQPRV